MVRLPFDEGPIPVVLIGNKCDVEKGDGQVDRSHLNRFCKDHDFTAWFDTSAYSGEGIEESIRKLVEGVLAHPTIFDRKRYQHATFKPELHKPQTALQRLQKANTFNAEGCC